MSDYTLYVTGKSKAKKVAGMMIDAGMTVKVTKKEHLDWFTVTVEGTPENILTLNSAIASFEK